MFSSTAYLPLDAFRRLSMGDKSADKDRYALGTWELGVFSFLGK